MGCTSNTSKKIVSDTIVAKSQTIHPPRPERVEELKIGASTFVIKKEGLLKETYTIGPKLGEGAFGFVRLGTHKLTDQKRAIKTISKDSIEINLVNKARFFTEVDILSEADHPNIVRLYEFYEDKNFFHLVTEYVEGGELFEFIVESKLLSEPIAAHFMKELLSAVSYCHANNIVHRDLKPENLLLDRKSPDATLKVIDFGTSTVIEESKSLSQRFGTAYYIAPEVLLKNYNEKCDIWSCGVIMYILLCGKPPFYGRQDKDILRKVSKGEYSFKGNEWKNVSDAAKKLIEKMLDLDPRTRISATEAMQDEWILTTIEKEDFEITELTLNNIENFRAEQKLQHAVLTFIASQLLSKEELSRLADTFRQVDTNGDGKLSQDELLEAYSKIMGLESARAEVAKIMREVDVNNSGFVDYTEFIMASTKKEVLLSKENIDKAFLSFDSDGNGKISAEEIKRMFGGSMGSDEIWIELIAEVDENGDGEVDINEFKAMMMKLFDLE